MNYVINLRIKYNFRNLCFVQFLNLKDIKINIYIIIIVLK